MDYRSEQALKQQALQQSSYASGGTSPGPSYSVGGALAPSEPGAADKAREALAYIREMEALQRELRLRLYGPFPESGENSAKDLPEPCLDAMLRDICQRSAMAVGEFKGILARL